MRFFIYVVLSLGAFAVLTAIIGVGIALAP